MRPPSGWKYVCAMREQKSRGLELAVASGVVQAGPPGVLPLRVGRSCERGLGGKHRPYGVHVAFGTGVEEAGDNVRVPPVQFFLQLAPAREAVLACNFEQRSGELGRRIDAVCPVSASSGWKSGYLMAADVQGWVRSFTRTVGRPFGLAGIVARLRLRRSA